MVYQAPYLAKGTRTEQTRMNKAACEASGGYWDERTQTCKLKSIEGFEPTQQTRPNPNVTTENIKLQTSPQTTSQYSAELRNKRMKEAGANQPQVTNPKVNPTQPEVTINEDNTATVILPDGRTLVGISKGDARGLLENWQQKQAPFVGYSPVGTAQGAANVQAQNQRLWEMAQAGLLTPEEMAAIPGSDLDFGQARNAAILNALPSALGGIATKTLGSSIVGGGAAAGVGAAALPLAIAGAAIYSISALVTGYKNSLKGQQGQEFAADTLTLRKGQRYLNALILETKANHSKASQNIVEFQKTLIAIDMAHAKTAKDANEDLNKALGSDGFEKLAEFRIFDDTMRQNYMSRFEAILAMPDTPLSEAEMAALQEGLNQNEENL